MNKQNKKVTIKDVAQLAGVSKGTVDRVIHNRGEVSDESIRRVADVIAKIDYKPNVYASMLASKRRYRIVCLLPDFDKGAFWGIVNYGVELAREECSVFNVSVETVHYDQFDRDSFRKAGERILSSPPDGVVMAPMFSDLAQNLVRELSKHHIPFVYVESRLPETDYLAYYGMQIFESGYLGARMLLKNTVPAAVVCFRMRRTGDAPSNTASTRLKGFESYLKEHFPTCKLYTEYLLPHDKKHNTQTLTRFFREHPEVKHIIIFNSRAYIVGEFLHENQMTDKTLLGYDPLEQNVGCMKTGAMEYIIAQRGATQSFRATKALCNYLAFKTSPVTRDNFMPMDILTAENVDYYTDIHDQQ